jgi:hypothetical protein
MTTKKESVYIICTICKKTILISKFFPERKSDLGEIHEYHYNLINTIPFNPYLKDPSDPLHLPKECEYSIYDNKDEVLKRIRKEKVVEKMPRKYDVYKPVFETINEITERIRNMGYYGNDGFSFLGGRTDFLNKGKSSSDYVKPNVKGYYKY